MIERRQLGGAVAKGPTRQYLASSTAHRESYWLQRWCDWFRRFLHILSGRRILNETPQLPTYARPQVLPTKPLLRSCDFWVGHVSGLQESANQRRRHNELLHTC